MPLQRVMAEKYSQIRVIINEFNNDRRIISSIPRQNVVSLKVNLRKWVKAPSGFLSQIPNLEDLQFGQLSIRDEEQRPKICEFPLSVKLPPIKSLRIARASFCHGQIWNVWDLSNLESLIFVENSKPSQICPTLIFEIFPASVAAKLHTLRIDNFESSNTTPELT